MKKLLIILSFVLCIVSTHSQSQRNCGKYIEKLEYLQNYGNSPIKFINTIAKYEHIEDVIKILKKEGFKDCTDEYNRKHGVNTTNFIGNYILRKYFTCRISVNEQGIVRDIVLTNTGGKYDYSYDYIYNFEFDIDEMLSDLLEYGYVKVENALIEMFTKENGWELVILSYETDKMLIHLCRNIMYD